MKKPGRCRVGVFVVIISIGARVACDRRRSRPVARGGDWNRCVLFLLHCEGSGEFDEGLALFVAEEFEDGGLDCSVGFDHALGG